MAKVECKMQAEENEDLQVSNAHQSKLSWQEFSWDKVEVNFMLTIELHHDA